jgi:hypothetical protein
MVEQVNQAPARGYERVNVTGSGQTASAPAAGETAERGRARDTQETATDVERFRGQDRVAAERAAMPDVPRASSSQTSAPSWEKTIDFFSGEIAKLQKELEKLGASPEAMGKAMGLQFKLQNFQQIVNCIMKCAEIEHECKMRALR